MRQQRRNAFTSTAIARRIKDLHLAELADPRRARGQRYRWQGLIGALILGQITGCDGLRDVEDLTEELWQHLRGCLRIPGRISDTKLRDTLLSAKREELGLRLVRQIKTEHRRGNLEPSSLPFGVLAVDGKHSATVDNHFDHPDVQVVRPDEQAPYGLVRVLRAHLISHPSHVCVAEQAIGGDTNEMGTCCDLTRQILANYGHTDLFEMICVDAGNASLEHATLIHTHHKGYLFALKSTAGDLHAEAVRLLGELDESKAEVTRTTRERGQRVVRRLWRARLEEGYLNWSHARQVIRVQRVVYDEDGQEVSRGERYFVTNEAPGRLRPEGWLTLVQTYWQVENGGNWTADVIWKEDQRRTPWTRHPEGILVTSVLRQLGMNITRLLRQASRRGGRGGTMKWRKALMLALVALVDLDDSATESAALS